MASASEIRKVNGGMDYDTETTAIANPHYLTAKNLRGQTADGNTSTDMEQIRGALNRIDLGTVSVQSKRYAFYFNEDIETIPISKQIILNLSLPYNPTLADPITITCALPDTSANVVATLNAALTAPYDTLMAFSITADPNVIQCTIDDEDVFITKRSTGSAITDVDYNIYTVQEPVYSTDFENSVATLRPIAWREEGKYTYVWSALKRSVSKGGTSVSELGRFHYDPNYDVYNYTPVVRTRYWNLGVKKQFDDPKGESANGMHNAYWTDKFNPIRVNYSPLIDTKVSVNGTVVTALDTTNVDFTRLRTGLFPAKIRICDEERTVSSVTETTITVTVAFTQKYNDVDIDIKFICTNFIYSEGFYDSNTIDQQTRLVRPLSFHETHWQSQDTGGNLPAAMYRYIAQLTTKDGVSSNFSVPTREVPVYSAQSGKADLIIGDIDGTVTNKKNVIKISNISANGLYEKLRVGAIVYNNSGTTQYIFAEINFRNGNESNDVPTEVVIEHVGNEKQLPLAKEELLYEPAVFDTCATLEIVDRQMILGGITRPKIVDLTDWFGDVEHELIQGEISTSGTVDNFQLGEYALPENVYNKGGLMWNEMYRAGATAYYKNGYKFTYRIDEIKVDTSATNISTPNRRRAALTNVNLTDSDLQPLPVGIRFYFDFDAIVDGQRVGDILEKVEVVFTPVIPEVKAAGAVIISTSQTTDAVNLPANTLRPMHIKSTSLTTANRKYATFYSADSYYGNTTINFQSGDELHYLGQPTNATTIYTTPGSTFYEFSGQFSTGGVTTYATTDIDGIVSVNRGDFATLNTNVIQNYQANNAASILWAFESSYVINTADNLVKRTSYTDRAIYYAQIVHPVQYVDENNNKYGPVANAEYVSSGFFIYAPDTPFDGEVSMDVFYSDVFTQKVYIKAEYPRTGTTEGSGFSFYAQNRCNFQMRYATEKLPDITKSNEFVFPYSFAFFSGVGNQARLNAWLGYGDLVVVSSVTYFFSEQFSYNQAYSYRWDLFRERNFRNDLTFLVREPTGIYYSPPKPLNSFSDTYRIILPGNYTAVDAAEGDITKLIKVNSELYCIQQKGYKRFFLNASVLQVNTAAQVVLGGATPFSQPPYIITKFGSTHGPACFLGRSESGDDILFMIDTLEKKIFRFSSQGVAVISDFKHISSFLQHNLNFANNQFTPADGLGITGYFDKRFNEAMFVVRCQRVARIHDSSLTYTSGQYVLDPTTIGGDTFYGFDNYVYRAKQNVPGGTAITNGTYWEFIPFDDNRGYNFYTLVWSESNQTFKYFWDDVPTMLMAHQNQTLSPMPPFYASQYDDNRGKIGVKYTGDTNVWYTYEGDSGPEFYRTDSYIDIPYFVPVNWQKRAISFYVNGNKKPSLAEFRNATMYTYEVEADIEERRPQFYSGLIRNDSTVTNDPYAGGKQMISNYVIARFTLAFDNELGVINMTCVNFILLRQNYNK